MFKALKVLKVTYMNAAYVHMLHIYIKEFSGFPALTRLTQCLTYVYIIGVLETWVNKPDEKDEQDERAIWGTYRIQMARRF